MLEIKQFPQNMSDLPVDHQDPCRCLVSGLYEETTEVQGKTHTFYTYLTEGLRYNQPCLIVAMPEGISAPAYLEASTWMPFADEPGCYQVGEITYYVFRNAKGTPMLTVGRVKDMPHANYPRESWISYDEFMSRFSRKEDGTLLYMGKPAL